MHKPSFGKHHHGHNLKAPNSLKLLKLITTLSLRHSEDPWFSLQQSENFTKPQSLL